MHEGAIRFVQICTGTYTLGNFEGSDGVDHRLYGLDESGRVWVLIDREDSADWQLVESVPADPPTGSDPKPGLVKTRDELRDALDELRSVVAAERHRSRRLCLRPVDRDEWEGFQGPLRTLGGVDGVDLVDELVAIARRVLANG